MPTYRSEPPPKRSEIYRAPPPPPPKNTRKILAATVVGGGSLIASIIAAVLIAGALALGALGLIADSPAVIDGARRVIVPDQQNQYAAYDNSEAYPEPGNQGEQSSCTAWASAYALKSAQDKSDHDWDYNEQPAFSPAFVYNQINNGQDSGSLISEAMKLITAQGVCDLDIMPYDEKDYSSQPNSTQRTYAYPHKAKDWFTVSSVDQVKSAIVEYGGVVVGVDVYSDFDKLNENNPIFDVQSGRNRGGHAICLVGYDDEKQAFKLINSWGVDWGLDGFGWVSYDIVERDMQRYGAFSMTDAEE